MDWKKSLKYLIGILILFILFYKTGFAKIIDVLKTVDYWYFLLAFLVFTLSTFIAALNLWVLIKPLQLDLQKKPFLRAYLLSRVSALFLPGRLGDYSLAYFLKKEKIIFGEGIAAVTMDKLITTACSVIVGLIGLYLLFPATNIIKIIAYLIIGFIIGLALLNQKARLFIRKYVLRKYASYFTGFSLTLFSYLKENLIYSLLNLIITIFRIVVIAFSAFFMFKAVGVEVSLLNLILIGGLETLSNFIPLTINGLGIKQSVGVYFFSQIGIPPEITAARYVLGIIIQYFFGLLSIIFIKTKD